MNIIERLAQFKVYFGRSGMYINILNFTMILANFKILYSLKIPAVLLIIIGVSLVLILGKLDYHIIMKHEITHSNKQNDIKKQLDVIQKKIDDLTKEV